MRSAGLVALASSAIALASCNLDSGAFPGIPGRHVHPVLDQDYTAPFVGTWNVSGTLTMAGTIENFSGTQGISQTGYNTLAIEEMCPGLAATATLDSPATFSTDPLTCPPAAQTCGDVTVTYRSGTGQLQQGTLTVTFQGTAAGCGQTLPFTLAFSGALPPPAGHAPPLAVVAPTSAETDAGVPVSFDASGSTDPGGEALAFAWSIASSPSGSAPTLTGAATATPTFSSDVPGSYALALVVTAADGQTGTAVVPILVRPVLDAARSWVYLESDPGDYIGGGQTSFYTRADAALTLTVDGGHLAVGVDGEQSWSGNFVEPSTMSQLEPGLYDPVTRYPFHDPAAGGLDWSGEGRGCNTLTGWFAIDEVTYSGSAIATLDLRFEQHCEGGVAALHGRIHWNAADATAPAGPVNPPPAGLWQPAAGATPASGSYVYLQSDVGDYIGAGASHLYTQADAVLGVTSSGGHLGVTVNGDESWWGDFQAMSTLAQLEPGYYGDLSRYPFHNPARGGLDWWGEGRGCNTLTGWFVVDGVAYSGGTLTAIDLRFEQHCEGGATALHGQIRWDAGNTAAPPGPVSPPPQGLWQPAAGTTPASGSYVILESDAGDWVGQGGTYLYTQASAVLEVTSSGGHVAVTVNGDESWGGDFQAMSTLAQLEPGYYGNLSRYPFHNPARGGLDWSGEGRGCNTLTGWFVVDGITYSGSAVSAIDLRFEQHCEGAGPALRGQIHWYAGDTTAPPGPVSPPPASLWEPAAGTTPASGSYVYLQSDAGDYIGAGGTYLYTQADAVLGVTASGGHLGVTVNGDESWWGDFQAMSSLTQLEPGYYGDLSRYPFHNPVRGGLSWSGEGRGCNTLTGWFVVDGIAYSGSTVSAIDLRFEQHCEGGGPALRGQIRWDAADQTAPPGPVSPPPAGLWQPAAGTTPASGSYVYLQSDAGDYIGAGGTYLYTPANAALGVTASDDGHLGVTVNGDESWWGDFQAMSTLAQLEPGYYGDLSRYPFHNPVRGGLDWWGEGRGCNTLAGWFVVDGVAYSGGTLTAIDLRFEQHCEGGVTALHGQLRWSSGGP